MCSTKDCAQGTGAQVLLEFPTSASGEIGHYGERGYCRLQLRERRLPTALGSIDLAFLVMACPSYCARQRPDGFHRPRRLGKQADAGAGRSATTPRREPMRSDPKQRRARSPGCSNFGLDCLKFSQCGMKEFRSYPMLSRQIRSRSGASGDRPDIGRRDIEIGNESAIVIPRSERIKSMGIPKRLAM